MLALFGVNRLLSLIGRKLYSIQNNFFKWYETSAIFSNSLNYCGKEISFFVSVPASRTLVNVRQTRDASVSHFGPMLAHAHKKVCISTGSQSPLVQVRVIKVH